MLGLLGIGIIVAGFFANSMGLAVVCGVVGMLLLIAAFMRGMSG